MGFQKPCYLLGAGLLLVLQASYAVEVTCPSPSKLRGTECFFVSEDGNDLLDWDESRQRCLSMGGDLAQPQDMVDFVEYIKESYANSKSTIWLGATDREVEQDWNWVSGDPVPPAMWEPWPHNQPSGDGNCMEIHWWPKTGFYMNDWFCHNKGHFACEFNHILENDDVEDTSSESDGDEDTSEGGGVEDTPCNWPTGQQYWPHPTNCRMFVQCAPYGPQEMHCAPGTAWSQSLLTCDYEAKTDCGMHQPTAPPPDNPVTCPSPYKLRGTECLFVSEDGNDLLNWDESRQRCQSMGGDLAQPQDMVDFVEYIKESYNNSKSTIWLGATDKEVEQEWYWLSGEPVPPAMWEPWPGNQPSGDGNCLEIHWWPHTSFYMNDWKCNKKGHFACQFNMA